MRTREGLIIISDDDDIPPLAEKRGKGNLLKLFSVNQVSGGIFVPLIMREKFLGGKFLSTGRHIWLVKTSS